MHAVCLSYEVPVGIDLDSRQIFRGNRTNTISMTGHSGLREDVVEISNLLDFYRNGGVCCSECLRESGSVSRQALYELGIKFKIVKRPQALDDCRRIYVAMPVIAEWFYEPYCMSLERGPAICKKFESSTGDRNSF